MLLSMIYPGPFDFDPTPVGYIAIVSVLAVLLYVGGWLWDGLR